MLVSGKDDKLLLSNNMTKVSITASRRIFWTFSSLVLPWRYRTLPNFARHSLRAASSQSKAGNKGSKRGQVTIINDTGAVRWEELSAREKAARATQQTFNYGIVIIGAIGTVRRPKSFSHTIEHLVDEIV
jgi:hypothetical protein